MPPRKKRKAPSTALASNRPRTRSASKVLGLNSDGVPEQREPASVEHEASSIRFDIEDKVGRPFQKRATHEVFPNLFLGGAEASRRVEMLKKLGVKGIVNLTTKMSNAAPKQFEYLTIRIDDAPSVRLSDHFDEILAFIKKHHDNGDAVLIHCRKGVSRSASCVLAFCVRFKGMTLLEAYQFLLQRRTCICPNRGFREQLIAFERKERGAVSVDEDRVMAWPHARWCDCWDCWWKLVNEGGPGAIAA